MKRLLITILLATILFCMPASGKNLNAWLVGGYDDTLTARLLYDVTPNISVGPELTFLDLENLPGNAGLCALYKFPDAVQIPNPTGIGPKEVSGTPYIGARAGIDVLNDSGTYSGLIAGMVIQDVVVIEYWPTLGTNFKLEGAEQSNEGKVFVGLMFKF